MTSLQEIAVTAKDMKVPETPPLVETSRKHRRERTNIYSITDLSTKLNSNPKLSGEETPQNACTAVLQDSIEEPVLPRDIEQPSLCISEILKRRIPQAMNDVLTFGIPGADSRHSMSQAGDKNSNQELHDSHNYQQRPKERSVHFTNRQFQRQASEISSPTYSHQVKTSELSRYNSGVLGHPKINRQAKEGVEIDEDDDEWSAPGQAINIMKRLALSRQRGKLSIDNNDNLSLMFFKLHGTDNDSGDSPGLPRIKMKFKNTRPINKLKLEARDEPAAVDIIPKLKKRSSMRKSAKYSNISIEIPQDKQQAAGVQAQILNDNFFVPRKIRKSSSPNLTSMILEAERALKHNKQKDGEIVVQTERVTAESINSALHLGARCMKSLQPRIVQNIEISKDSEEQDKSYFSEVREMKKPTFTPNGIAPSESIKSRRRVLKRLDELAEYSNKSIVSISTKPHNICTPLSIQPIPTAPIPTSAPQPSPPTASTPISPIIPAVYICLLIILIYFALTIHPST